MSPHSANEENESDKKTKQTKNVEGEISIDHSHKPAKPEAVPKPAPAPEKADEKPVHQTTHTPEIHKSAVDEKPATVVVPGGVSSSSPNPSTYFRSKYHGGSGPKTETPVSQQPVYGMPPADPISHASYTQSNIQRKRLFGIAGAVAVLILIIIGYVFGVYIPNKPENAYATGMSRTGKALDSILTNATKSDTLDKFLKSEGTGTFEAKIDDETISGTVASKMDHSKLDLKLNATSKISGQPDKNYQVAALADLSNDSSNSAIYFKSDGIGFFGLEGLIPALGAYDGKWISVKGDYSKKLVHKYATLIGDQIAPGPLSTASGTSANAGSISNDDVAALASTFSDITNSYLFTKDSSKAVLVNKEYVGKEDTDAGKAYHYKVGIDKDNYAAYCKALSDGLIESKVYQNLIGVDPSSLNDAKANGQAACDQSKDSITSGDTIDLWIDAKYKLIYKIKFVDSQDTGSYFEVGQNYKGKDTLQVFYNYSSVSLKSESHAIYDVNLKSAESQLKFDLSSEDSNGKTSLALNMTNKPYDGSVQITPPSGATPLEKITRQTGQDLNSLISPDEGLVPKNKVN